MEKLEPGDLGVAHVDHDAGTLPRLDAHLAQCLAQKARLFAPWPVPIVPVSPHGPHSPQ